MLATRLHHYRQSVPSGLWYVGSLLRGKLFQPAMKASVCRLPGLLAAGQLLGLDNRRKTPGESLSHLSLAVMIGDGCIALAAQTGHILPRNIWINAAQPAKLHQLEEARTPLNTAISWFTLNLSSLFLALFFLFDVLLTFCSSHLTKCHKTAQVTDCTFY